MKVEFWTYEPLFGYDEFACKCGKCGVETGLNMRISQMDKLERMRRACEADARKEGQTDYKFAIDSGFRCQNHESEQDKKEGGTHFLGYAVDIRAKVGSWKYSWIYRNAHKFGFNRVGLANSFIHIDSFSGDERIPCPAEWTYNGFKGKDKI